MNARLSLSMKTTLDELPRIGTEIEKFARGASWSPRLEFQIRLAIEEVVVNVVNHGHGRDGDHAVEIELASAPDRIDIEIIDDGRPFDPLTETPAPNTDLPLSDRPVGGLGVYLVCALMDEARYRREGGRNCLALVKRRQE